jgi:hypothetical protein
LLILLALWHDVIFRSRVLFLRSDLFICIIMYSMVRQSFHFPNLLPHQPLHRHIEGGFGTPALWGKLWVYKWRKGVRSEHRVSHS